MSWSLLYSAGTQHGNLHQLSVTMSRVTYFIPRIHTGTGVGHGQHRKNWEEVLEKCRQMDRKGRSQQERNPLLQA